MPNTAALHPRPATSQTLSAQAVAKLYDTDLLAWANVNAQLLRDNPSFLPKLQAVVDEEYPGALENAVFETGLSDSSFPTDCPYSVESVTDDNWLPQ